MCCTHVPIVIFWQICNTNCRLLYSHNAWIKNDHNSLYKNICVLLFFPKELKLLWFVKQADGGRQDRLLYQPITSSLDHSTLCYLQDPLSTSAASRPELLNRRPGMGHRPQRVRSQWLQAGFDSAFTDSNSFNWRPLRVAVPSGAFSLTASLLSLWPSLCPTHSTAAGICIYYFITPTYFGLDHVIFFRLFTHVRLWLTARSRVNM